MAVMRCMGLIALLALVGCSTSTTRVESAGVPPVEDARAERGEAVVPAEGASAQPGPAESRAQARTEQDSAPAKPRVKASQHEAVVRLQRRAEQQLAQGQYAAAIDTAERGLRLDRYSAKLYYLIAQAYAQQGVLGQARNFAQLGLRYAGSNDSLRSQLEVLAAE